MSCTTETTSAVRGERGKAVRRTRVIESAMYLAAGGGYEAVQMREVADRAEVSLGTIYRYFKGKDDVLLAGLVGWVHLLRLSLESEPAAGDTPSERLASMLCRAARATEGSPVLMGALVTALSTTDPAAARYKIQIETEFREMMETTLGQESGFDAAGVAKVVGHVWLSAILHWIGGLAPAGSVEAELCHAVDLLVGPRRAMA